MGTYLSDLARSLLLIPGNTLLDPSCQIVQLPPFIFMLRQFTPVYGTKIFFTKFLKENGHFFIIFGRYVFFQRSDCKLVCELDNCNRYIHSPGELWFLQPLVLILTWNQKILSKAEFGEVDLWRGLKFLAKQRYSFPMLFPLPVKQFIPTCGQFQAMRIF